MNNSVIDIHKLVVTNDTARLQNELLKSPNRVNELNSRGETPLYCAISTGNRIQAVRILVKHGADVNYNRDNYYSVLHCALTRNDANVGIVKILLDKGADANMRDEIGKTPLHPALQYGHLDAAKLLLERGADCNIRDCNKMTPINGALFFGIVREDMEPTFSTPAIEVNCYDNDTMTPERSKRDLYRRQVVKLLLEYGADVNLKDMLGNTPFLDYASCGDIESLSDMLRHGASVNVRNRQGHAALESLLFSFRRVNTSFCLPFLLDNHAKMNVECYAAIMSKDKYRSAYIKWKASWQYRRQYISFVSGVQPGTCRALLENDDKHICRYLCDGNIIRSICLYLGPWPSGLV